MIPELIKRYVDTGKIRLVSRQFPLTSIHFNAQKAAEAAVCAGKQARYWEMHDKLFATQADWEGSADPIPTFKQYAADLGLDTKAFDQCLDKGEAALDVNADAMLARNQGLPGTPYFYANDLPLPQGLSVDAMGLVIEYVAAGGKQPEILPQDTSDFHVQGSLQTAQAGMAVFVDYTSSEAATYMAEVYPQIEQQYIVTGTLIYIFHPWATEKGSLGFQAAAAAECAGQQGKFAEMQDQLFKNQTSWLAAQKPGDAFAGYASTLGLDAAKFQECLTSDWAALRVLSGPAVAVEYGPLTSPGYILSDGSNQVGMPTFDAIKTSLDAMIGQ